MKVAEAIAQAMAAEAEGPIFGLMGDANMSIWDGLTRQDVTMIHTRYDAAAVLMADGFARATGKLGIATVTCGPGLANCANAILTAARASSPVVVVTGEYAPFGKGTLQAFDTALFARTCEAGFKSLTDLDTMAEEISEAFYQARTRKGPVIISLPAKYWEAELPWSWEYQPSSQFIVAQPEPDRGAVERVARLLAEAERPVIIAGRGAVIADARAELEELAELSGALLATSLLGKGLFQDNPWDVGISGSYSSKPTEKLMADADFVLGVGASLNFFTTEGGMLFPSAKVARIDVKPYPNDIGVVPGDYVRGDAKVSALALVEALKAMGVRKDGYRTGDTRAQLKVDPIEDLRTDGIDPRDLMSVLSTCLPERVQVITDAGQFWVWPHAYLAMPRGARYQQTCNFGSVGLAVSQGIGAALGAPDRLTIVVTGDGGLLQCIQELHVAAQYKVPVIVIVMNDAGYGAEVHKMNAKHMNPRDVVWDSPDFVAVARGFGGDGKLIESSDALPEAFAEATRFKGPYVIDARISTSITGDYYQRIYMGRENPTPLLRMPPAQA